MDEKAIWRVVDKDYCPKYDNIIYRKQCTGCDSYCTFKIDEFGQQCINCAYTEDAENSAKGDDSDAASV